MRLFVRLQRLDSELFDVLSMQRGLPEEIHSLKEKAAAYIDILNARKKRYDEGEVQKRLLASEIKASQEKIKKYKDAQTTARNNKEYDALSKQIEFEEAEIKKAESKIKSIDEERQRQLDLEAKGKALLDENNDNEVTDEMLPTEHLQMRLKTIQIEVDAKSNELASIIRDTQADITALNEKIKAVRDRIVQSDKHLLSKYDALRSGGIQNIVVHSKSYPKTDKKNKNSETANMYCSGCNFKVPASQYALIRRGGLYICESCGRLIVSEELFKEELND